MRPLASEVDDDLLELIIVRRKVGEAAVVNSPLFPFLCEYLKKPSTLESVNVKLFARLLQSSEIEVAEKLHLESPSERMKDAVDQLYHSGFKLEAGMLLLSSHATHPALATLNSALESMKAVFK